MKLGKTREEVIQIIKLDIPHLIKDSKKMEEVLLFLEEKHEIPRHLMLNVLNDSTQLESLNQTELGLLGEQIAIKVYQKKNWMSEFFTENEISKMNIYKKPTKEFKIKRSFKPAIKLNDNVFMIGLSRQDIATMYDNGLFTWDEDVQREGVRKTYGDAVIAVPKINNTNVKEIAQQALEGVLVENELAYNLVLGSSSEGQELYYNEDTFELTFAEDFEGQIIDGMHRTIGIHRAWMENNNITGTMPIRISNYTTSEAARYQVELSKAVPIDKSRLQVLSKERLCDRIVDNLRIDGHLKGRISETTRPSERYNEIVSYKTLSDAFYEFFEKEGNLKVVKIMEQFKEYLLYLFEYFDEYLEDNNSALFKNVYFYLHVYIFKKMLNEEIPFSNLNKIIKPEYFNLDSEVLTTYKINAHKENQIRSKRWGLKFVDDVLFDDIEVNK